ncbi:MAG: type IV pilin protein [Planctomycetota bacterium]|jgi:prepilin-type N-terminal cleavage/methylation domain-containing protein
MESRKGFTLIELMVVILIVGILAAVAVPIMRGRIDSAKWSEANASAGAIRSSVRAYIAEKGPNFDYSGISGTLDTQAIYEELGFSANDLAGAYFNQADYTVGAVDAAAGTCTVDVTSTHAQGPAGTYQLEADGDWVKQ